MKRETETEQKKRRRSQRFGYEGLDGITFPLRALKKKKLLLFFSHVLLLSRCNLNEHRGEEAGNTGASASDNVTAAPQCKAAASYRCGGRSTCCVQSCWTDTGSGSPLSRQYQFPRGAITLVSLILSLNKRELNGRFLRLLGLDSGEEETPAASFSARQG